MLECNENVSIKKNGMPKSESRFDSYNSRVFTVFY